MPELPTAVVAEAPQVFVLIRDEEVVGYLFGLLLDLDIAEVRQDL
ncbi:hypothetical protein [Micromonospora orduensis]|nr:hypothetical protein [Micromonospora orduensis]